MSFTAKQFPEIVRQYSQVEQQLNLTNEILNQPIAFKSNPTKKLLAGFMGGLILSSAIAILLELYFRRN